MTLEASHNLVIWGTGGQAAVVADIIQLEGHYRIRGFLDDFRQSYGEEFMGAEILGGRDILTQLRHEGIDHIILAFGDSNARLNLGELVRSKGFTLATAIHPSAVIAKTAEISAGSMVAAGAIVNPLGFIGENVIVGTLASIDHHSMIHKGVTICPGVHIAGHVTVGQAAWVGIGSIIKDRVHIGEGALVGAGAVVVEDIPPNVIAYGIPAKPIRDR